MQRSNFRPEATTMVLYIRGSSSKPIRRAHRYAMLCFHMRCSPASFAVPAVSKRKVQSEYGNISVRVSKELLFAPIRGEPLPELIYGVRSWMQGTLRGHPS